MQIRIPPKRSGSDQKGPDPTKKVQIRPKRSGSGSATLVTRCLVFLGKAACKTPTYPFCGTYKNVSYIVLTLKIIQNKFLSVHPEGNLEVIGLHHVPLVDVRPYYHNS
jgi:hypothetical protein